MKHRFVTPALVVLGLAVAFLAAPQASHAAALVNLRGVTLVCGATAPCVDTTNHTMTVRSTNGTTTADFTVTYTLDTTTTNTAGKTITILGTRVSGNPRNITKFTDWRNGDPLNVTGSVVGYESGILKVTATQIEYRLAGVATKTLVGMVENKNVSSNQLSLSIRPGALYTQTQISNIGQPGGPTLTGATNVDSIKLGSSVQATQVWRPDPVTGKTMKFKDLAVKVLTDLPPTAVVWVMRVTSDPAGANTITSGFTQPLTLVAGNKIALQNETTKTLYLKVADSDRASYTAALANGYAMVRAGGVATLITKAPVTIGAATFSQPVTTLRTLAVVRAGAGSVSAKTANDTVPGIDCGKTCTAPFADGVSVILTATKGATSNFTGWTGGGCTGTSTCTVTMTEAKTVTATFGTLAANYSLTVTKAGTGTGTVVSGEVTTPKINCGTTCSAALATNSSVTLTATATSPSTFTGWSGACSGTATCTVTADGAKSVTATFTLPTPLSVTRSGGAGDISSVPAGLSCNPDTISACTGSFTEGANVTLTAQETPAPNAAGCYHLNAWGGGCSGTGTCSVVMSANKTVTAAFTYGACME